MIRLLTGMIALVSSLMFVACQTYTSSLVESTNRVDETVALSTLRSIDTAQKLYSVTHEGNYGTLPQLSEAGYLDSRFKQDKPLKDYLLTVNVKSASDGGPSYSCVADPEADRPGRHFYIDSSSGTIHVNPTQRASPSDPTIQ